MKQDHEAVRTLAIQVGVRESARRLGLNEDRVRQWSKREQWFTRPADKQNAIVTTVTRPGDVLLDELADNKRETKLSLSRYARRASKDAEECTVKDAPLVHKVAQVAGIVWPEEQNAGNQFTLNVLNLSLFQGEDQSTLDE